MASYYALQEPRGSFTLWPTKVPAISESREIPINPQARQLKAQDHRTMEAHQSVGRVLYLPDGSFYVQACLPGVNFCPEVHVSDAGLGECRDGALMDTVDTIDSHGNNEEEVPATAAPRSVSLLDVVDAIDSDDDDETVGAQSQASLQDAVSAMNLDSEELPDEQTRPTQVAMSGAALDLCPPIDLDRLSDTDSSSSSEEESDDYDSEDTESDEEFVGRRTARAPQVSLWECDYLPVADVDKLIRANMAEVEAKKPWRFVFRCLKVPFNFKRINDPFDVFFMRWDEFWLVHGRAVWERDFWQPLVPGSTEYYRRKWRQTRAQRAFRELATDLLQRLGEDYRLALGKALKEGWWYRTEPFPLRRLFLKNCSLYEEYLATRVTDRWPRGKNFLMKRGLKPLWWLTDSSPSTGTNSNGL